MWVVCAGEAVELPLCEFHQSQVRVGGGVTGVKVRRQLMHCTGCVQRFVAARCRGVLDGELWAGDFSACDQVRCQASGVGVVLIDTGGGEGGVWRVSGQKAVVMTSTRSTSFVCVQGRVGGGESTPNPALLKHELYLYPTPCPSLPCCPCLPLSPRVPVQSFVTQRGFVGVIALVPTTQQAVAHLRRHCSWLATPEQLTHLDMLASAREGRVVEGGAAPGAADGAPGDGAAAASGGGRFPPPSPVVSPRRTVDASPHKSPVAGTCHTSELL